MERNKGLSNFHTHCGLDDGTGTMEEYVLSALSKGFDALGFSCHAPGTLNDGWHMKKEDFPYYLEEIDRLRNLYRDRIEIYVGLELDFLDDTEELVGNEYRDQLDYTIASVHVMKHAKSDTYLSIDGPIEEFETLLHDNFNGIIQQFVGHYYEMVERMMSLYSFDILGHCDVIKKRNGENRYFDPSAPWYAKLTKSMLKAAKKHKVRIEVNTGGIARGATQESYPSVEMIEECAQLGIPLTLSSDAHQSSHIDFYFSQADDQLVQAGYRNIDILQHGMWQSVSIV
ncbi:histidinol-phosphatase [Pleomorphochaeta sp. DL1XJH-081]|uniref:histidinol-phosphatase n=1 Tax=Pleomorphochaeta sp. DL1XJH-081 TaxID=3409690 RepID=UPI003BB6DF21